MTLRLFPREAGITHIIIQAEDLVADAAADVTSTLVGVDGGITTRRTPAIQQRNKILRPFVRKRGNL